MCGRLLETWSRRSGRLMVTWFQRSVYDLPVTARLTKNNKMIRSWDAAVFRFILFSEVVL